MARGREGMAKRERERVRQERQEAKRLKKESAAAEDSPEVDEAHLMEEFRLLSERHAAGRVPETTYASERRRIFDELGIDVDD